MHRWYRRFMSTTYAISMGDRGRLVVPRELRDRQEWSQGTELLVIESPGGVVLVSREQALALLRSQLAGASLVEELVAQRRLEAQRENG